MAKRKSNRFVDQATLEALVRFGPQLDALREAQRTAEGTFATSVAQAKSGARAVTGAIDQARPQIESVYGKSGLRQADANASLLGGDLAGLSGVANSIKAGSVLEAQRMAGNLREAEAAALTDLSKQRVQAQAGSIAQQRAAQSQLVQDLTRILQARKDTEGQRGAFTAATIGQLQEAARSRAAQLAMNDARLGQQERNSVRSSGIDPDTGLPIPGGKLDPKTKAPKKGSVTATGAKPVSPDAHLQFANRVKSIMGYAQRWKGASRAEIVRKLTQGRPQQRITVDPETGEKLKQPVTLPKIPSFEPDIAMTAALDVALDGHLSRETQRQLQAHYILRDLGLPTYGEWVKKNGRPNRAASKSTDQAIDTVRKVLSSLGG